MEKQKQKSCFVICPIGEENSPTRKRSDQIFEYIIKPKVIEIGYSPFRSDHISKPGLITSQIISALFDSDLVIADLSEHNPIVFYELAIRHATQKPVIQLIEKDGKIPFDIAGLRTIYINTKEFDLESVERAKVELSEQIVSIEGGNHKIENPIFDALRLKFLKESHDPGQIQLANLFQEISNIKSEILYIKNAVVPDNVKERLISSLIGLQSDNPPSLLWETYINKRSKKSALNYLEELIKEKKADNEK